MNKEMFPIEQGPQISKERQVSDEEKARAYVRDLNFLEALDCLHKEGLLSQEVLRTKETYGESMEAASFMTEEDWEYLTIISLYSPELATHSVETYRLIHSKIGRIHIGSETIAEIIEKEAGSLDVFYRAALFHDIGKLNIPESVMNHVVRPGNWYALMYATSNPEQLHSIYNDNGELIPVTKDFDAVAFMSDYDFNKSSNKPASSILPPEKIAELIKRGISPELTLRQIWSLHEEGTQKNLEGVGLHEEAEIAGQVHGYHTDEHNTPTSSETIAVSADVAAIQKIILQLGDSQEALRSNERGYKKSHSQLATAGILAQDAEKAVEDTERTHLKKLITALWLAVDVNEIKEEIKKESESKMSAQETKEFEELKDFIRTNLL